MRLRMFQAASRLRSVGFSIVFDRWFCDSRIMFQLTLLTSFINVLQFSHIIYYCKHNAFITLNNLMHVWINVKNLYNKYATIGTKLKYSYSRQISTRDSFMSGVVTYWRGATGTEKQDVEGGIDVVDDPNAPRLGVTRCHWPPRFVCNSLTLVVSRVSCYVSYTYGSCQIAIIAVADGPLCLWFPFGVGRASRKAFPSWEFTWPSRNSTKRSRKQRTPTEAGAGHLCRARVTRSCVLHAAQSGNWSPFGIRAPSFHAQSE